MLPWIAGLVLTSGCIVIETPVTLCCGEGAGTELTTTSVVDRGGLALSLTDVDGPLACALAEDDELELGKRGTQLFLRVNNGYFLRCDDASYTLGGPECGPGEGVPKDCGRLRTWDAQGRLVEESWAVSGAVIVHEGPSGACHFDIEAVLPGGRVVEGTAKTAPLDVWGDDASCDEG